MKREGSPTYNNFRGWWMHLAGTTFSKNRVVVLFFWHKNNEMWEEKEPEKLHMHCSQQSSEARLESHILPNSPARGSSENIWELIYLHPEEMNLGRFWHSFLLVPSGIFVLVLKWEKGAEGLRQWIAERFLEMCGQGEKGQPMKGAVFIGIKSPSSQREELHCHIWTEENWHGRKVLKTSSQGKLFVVSR